jgi:tRNA dimethylallyltransferase
LPKHEQAAVIGIMGPTASGKSALAMQLARRLNGEIISVDSALVYKGMDIGTAKPGLADRAEIPHHLIDIIDPVESFSTGAFRNQALSLIDQIHARGKLPILVGGTMLYFNALTQGLAQLPVADEAVRNRLDKDCRELGKEEMHRRLGLIDPAAAQRIHPNDPQRVQRALEVYELTGTPISELIKAGQANSFPFKMAKIIVAPNDRKLLHQMIAQRFMQMLDQGFIEEVQGLLNRGDLNEKLPSIRAVGYRQLWSYLKGEYDYATMVEKGIAATRQLAKRQFTWLRRESDAHWFESAEGKLVEQVLQHLRPDL